MGKALELGSSSKERLGLFLVVAPESPFQSESRQRCAGIQPGEVSGRAPGVPRSRGSARGCPGLRGGAHWARWEWEQLSNCLYHP